MLTKHSFELFSFLIPYSYVFCGNEEVKTKSKQFGQEKKKAEKIFTVATWNNHDCGNKRPKLGPQRFMVATVKQKNKLRKMALNEVATVSHHDHYREPVMS